MTVLLLDCIGIGAGASGHGKEERQLVGVEQRPKVGVQVWTRPGGSSYCHSEQLQD